MAFGDKEIILPLKHFSSTFMHSFSLTIQGQGIYFCFTLYEIVNQLLMLFGLLFMVKQMEGSLQILSFFFVLVLNSFKIFFVVVVVIYIMSRSCSFADVFGEESKKIDSSI